ncbi:MAG: M42 family metallopeptidase [Promethearchaeota archaeon]
MDGDDLFSILREVAEIPGPVGREGEVQDYLENEWKRSGFATRRDGIGNLFGRMEGRGPRWAIVGHADSIGFIVQQVLPDGFVKVAFNTAASTPDARFLAGKKLNFLVGSKEKVRGYFGLRSGHLAGIEGKKKPVLFEDMFVDMGVNSADEVRDLGVDVGTSAVFATPVEVEGSNIVGPSMDNRIAGAIQCAIARRCASKGITPNLTLISTVQEEIGMKGAAAAARFVASEKYDGVIVIDVGLTGGIPGSKLDSIDVKLGAGPIILYKDFAIHYSMDLIQMLEGLARKNEIPFQKAVFKNYRTDGMYFFMEGLPTAMVAVPCRYTHTDFETIRLVDLELTVSLVESILRVPDGKE